MTSERDEVARVIFIRPRRRDVASEEVIMPPPSTTLRADEKQSIPLDGPPLSSVPRWGPRIDFPDVSVQLTPSGPREFNLSIERTFASISFGASEGLSTLAGDRLRRFERRAYEYYIAPPHFPLRGVSEDGPEVLTLAVDFPALRDEIAAALGVDADALQSDVVIGAPEPFLIGLAQRIRKQLLMASPSRRCLEALCLSMLVEMCRPLVQSRQKTAKATVDAATMRRLLRHIEEDIGGDLSIGSLAARVGATRDQLSRAFCAHTGQPPHGFVMSKRLDRARRLICEGGASLAEIAARVGFSSQSHMTSAFKRHLGQTPGGLRRARTRTGVEELQAN